MVCDHLEGSLENAVDRKETRTRNFTRSEKKVIAEDGFDPSTCGLWAHHASTAPLCLYRGNLDLEADYKPKKT